MIRFMMFIYFLFTGYFLGLYIISHIFQELILTQLYICISWIAAVIMYEENAIPLIFIHLATPGLGLDSLDTSPLIRYIVTDTLRYRGLTAGIFPTLSLDILTFKWVHPCHLFLVQITDIISYALQLCFKWS